MPAIETDQPTEIDAFAAARRLQTPTWLYDTDNPCVVHANAAACELWQADTEAELKARDMTTDMSATVAKRLRQYQADFIARDTTFNELWTLFPKGVPTSVRILFSGFRLPDGRMGMLCEVLGTPNPQPDNLRSAEALLHTDVMIALFSVAGPPLYMNPAARNMSHDPNAALLHAFVLADDFRRLMSGLENTGEHRQITQIRTMEGPRWLDVTAKRCSDAATGDPAILVTAIDVTELKIARDQARYLASRDQLTGCFNRSYLSQYIAQLDQSSAAQSALLYFDVDRFKQINDTYGHDVGDAVLVALAQLAGQNSNVDDIVVRLGGDEFVVVFSRVDIAMLAARVESFFNALSIPTQCGPISVNTKVSMGVTVFDPTKADVNAVLRQADIALYLAKNNGRNQYIFYDDAMGSAAAKRSRTEAEIEGALKRREFELYYQPRLDVKSGKITSVEGLARWRHPDRGLVGPDDFIPICEDSGMIHLLGQQVLEMGFDQAIAWHKAGIATDVSLNISPRQFSDDQLIETLTTYAEIPDFPAHKIELEITESVLIGDQGGIAAKLRAITDMGYQISVDDFGTGYSNLSDISRFPLTCLKIDRSFVVQLPQTGAIVRLILALAQQLDVTVVAEGVETQDQFDWLKQNGCTEIQGFFVAKPAPAADIERSLVRTLP